MGLDIHVRLIVGYKVNYEKVKKKVIKFDADTGIPYEKIIEEIVCDDAECIDEMEDFIFGYVDKNEEYQAIRGKSLYYSNSHRNVNNQIDLFVCVDTEYINHIVFDMKNKYPHKKIDCYIFPDSNW